MDAPSPNDSTQLQSFLGKMAFYDRFIPNRAEVCHALYALLDRVQHRAQQQLRRRVVPVPEAARQGARPLRAAIAPAHHQDTTSSEDEAPSRVRSIIDRVNCTPPPTPPPQNTVAGSKEEDGAEDIPRPPRRSSRSPAGWRRRHSDGAAVLRRAPASPQTCGKTPPRPRPASAPLEPRCIYPCHFTKRMKKRYAKQRREYLLFAGPLPTKWEEVDDPEVRDRLHQRRGTPPAREHPRRRSQSTAAGRAPILDDPAPRRTSRFDQERAEHVPLNPPTPTGADEDRASPAAASHHYSSMEEEDIKIGLPDYSDEEAEYGLRQDEVVTPERLPGEEAEHDFWQDQTATPERRDVETVTLSTTEGSEDEPPPLRPRRIVRPPSHLADFVQQLQEDREDAGNTDEELQLYVQEEEYDWGDLVDDLLQNSQ
ncbi:Pro-Pol polyprotein [Frankliniella fusca]|uniref:Pro-Pol polyprotein n=1 Tax=Frankliniella fusca TaxID=407009 RepID=A0AAE1HCJ3_9NEOP|nr:Pro-Pol polyprotein [Frankliniella fusca]